MSMPGADPKLSIRKVVSVFDKPLEVDVKKLFHALAKSIAHGAVGKWEELGSDAAETLSALGLTTGPEELAFLLIQRALARAMFSLVGESAGQSLAETDRDAVPLLEQMDFSLSGKDLSIDRKFLDRPEDLPLVAELGRLLQQWLEGLEFKRPLAVAISARLPSYFVYALNQEWRRNEKAYRPLLQALETPFAKASEREWAWAAYAALLQRRIHEPVFGELFGLSQIYIPLHAYYETEREADGPLRTDVPRASRRRMRIVTSIENELDRWLESRDPRDAVRVISGGPGSGKSCFARIFAARTARRSRIKVLFVPLHLIDATRDLETEIGRFVRDEGVLLQNPLDSESPETSLLIILDGLDELASQGNVAAEMTRAFVREVERTADRRNQVSLRVRFLISGRELVVQENQSEFRLPRQILTLLPYHLPAAERQGRSSSEQVGYEDPNGLLDRDLRQEWWKKYGLLTGQAFSGLPSELARVDLDEITAQPLLNYLVALSFTRGRVDFSADVNLNHVYSDLLEAVYERGYEKKRPYLAIRNMSPESFFRVLEEIGLATWHGDGRTTTVQEVEQHCRASGIGALLDVFMEGATAGVTRLLAAFFFRQHGQRPAGDPTFVFTHKTFGEYLVARRVVRAIEKLVRELSRRARNPDEGLDERDALVHWVRICGPSAISRYLHPFLLNEIRLRHIDEVVLWQQELAKLVSHVLRWATPMEQLHLPSFREAALQSRNAEEALLVALNSCARVTGLRSVIKHVDPTAFGAWFKRIQGQRTSLEPGLATSSLSHLNLEGVFVEIGDFYAADLSDSNLAGIDGHLACFGGANLRGADLRRADLSCANLRGANLYRANLHEADLGAADLSRANLREADLHGAKLDDATLDGADLCGANLRGANLRDANLDNAKLDGADVRGADFRGAHSRGGQGSARRRR